METIFGLDVQALLVDGTVIVAALISMVIAVANILTVFIDESKVNSFVKPVLDVLNFLALNIFNNKNATDTEDE